MAVVLRTRGSVAIIVAPIVGPVGVVVARTICVIAVADIVIAIRSIRVFVSRPIRIIGVVVVTVVIATAICVVVVAVVRIGVSATVGVVVAVIGRAVGVTVIVVVAHGG